MKDGGAATIKRKLVDVVHLHDREEHAAVRQRLEELIGKPVARKHFPPVIPASQPTTDVLTPGVPQPKPQGRIVDEELLRRFRDEHPRCALAGTIAGRECWYAPDFGAKAEAHHIKRRSHNGGDVAENLLPLCHAHHSGNFGWHSLHWSPKRWCLRYFHLLTPEWQGNVAASFPEGVPSHLRQHFEVDDR